MEETTFKKPQWHILKTRKGWKVYSYGLRCYGVFKTKKQAYNKIVKDFPDKRGEICVQNEIGIIIDKLYYPLKKLLS